MSTKKDNVHNELTPNVHKSRKLQILRHNLKTNVKSVSFRLGDYVLVKSALRNEHMLSLRWREPRSITKVISDLVYEVADIFSMPPKRERIHARRMILYRASMKDKEVSQKLIECAEFSISTYEIAVSLSCIKNGRRQNEDQCRMGRITP